MSEASPQTPSPGREASPQQPPTAAERFEVPPTPCVDHVDTYHGVKVADPYRWLEDDVRESEAVAAWVKAQNEVTQKMLATIPCRDAIRDLLRTRWNYERFSPLFKGGGRYFFFYNTGLQDQNVLYWTESLSQDPQVLIDPNGWSEDGTICLASSSVNSDGERVACLIQESGSDWMKCQIFDVDGGEFLPDRLEWIKHSHISWTRDCRGFFYSRFDAPLPGHEFQDLNTNHKVYYHRLGTPQSQDVLAYARPDHPTWGFDAQVTNDGHYLVITIWKGTDARFRVAVRDLLEPYSTAVDLIRDFDHDFSFVGHEGRWLFFVTDEGAPRRRLIAVDVHDPGNRREIIAQTEDNLTQVRFLGNLFVATYLRNAHSVVRIHSINGDHVRDVNLPGIGTVDGFFGRRADTETFYSFSSFVHPPAIYRYDLVTGESHLYRGSKVGVDPEGFEVKQVFSESRDGTKIPVFLVHRRGIELDGSNPTLLYGYGGFNAPLTPSFVVARLVWLEMGGVFAMANLRGGGEFGEDWHEAGTRLKKQNVFDDFIGAAEWLVREGYTTSAKLAIQGGSNGGLLVGAVMTQRPDLFGACLPAVGVMDMLRFHHFTAGRYWVDDYGSADDPEEFKALHAYSPYHNIRAQTEYPATMVTTADTDDRVVPGHSFKFAAALQAAQRGHSPVLIRIDVRTGHGAGIPTSKAIDKVTDQWAFLAHVLNFEVDIDQAG